MEIEKDILSYTEDEIREKTRTLIFPRWEQFTAIATNAAKLSQQIETASKEMMTECSPSLMLTTEGQAIKLMHQESWESMRCAMQRAREVLAHVLVAKEKLEEFTAAMCEENAKNFNLHKTRYEEHLRTHHPEGFKPTGREN